MLDPTRAALMSVLVAALCVSPAGAQAVDQTPAVSWEVAPGLTYTEFDRTDERGTVHVHVLTAAWKQPGLVLDQVSPQQLSRPQVVSALAAEGVAGVNGDFFDIGVTNAALGVARDRQAGLLHAPPSALSFYFDAAGVPRIGTLTLTGSARTSRRTLRVSAKNTPRVPPGGIALYTDDWGGMPGYDVVGTATEVRQVVIDGGKVVSNRATLSPPTTPMVGRALIGRGAAAAALAKLKVGAGIRVGTHLTTPVLMAISGNAQLLRAGELTTSADTLLHPRTAIGIDRDRSLLHLVTVDGRSESSSGFTLVQLATLMRGLGDEAALNLDGGGSAEMVASGADGVLGVRNTPSDGHERPVANALVFFVSD